MHTGNGHNRISSLLSVFLLVRYLLKGEIRKIRQGWEFNIACLFLCVGVAAAVLISYGVCKWWASKKYWAALHQNFRNFDIRITALKLHYDFKPHSLCLAISWYVTCPIKKQPAVGALIYGGLQTLQMVGHQLLSCCTYIFCTYCIVSFQNLYFILELDLKLILHVKQQAGICLIQKKGSI